MQKAQEAFELAQGEVDQAQVERELLAKEAPLLVAHAPQVNTFSKFGLLNTCGAPDAGPPPENLVSVIQEFKLLILTSTAEMDEDRTRRGWRPRQCTPQVQRGPNRCAVALQLPPVKESGSEAQAGAPWLGMGRQCKRDFDLSELTSGIGTGTQQLCVRAMQNPRDTELSELTTRAGALIPSLANWCIHANSRLYA